MHTSVMLVEVMELLRPVPGGLYVDSTVGMGGYSEAILELTDGQADIIGIDSDPEALTYSQSRLAKYGSNVRLIHNNFTEIDTVLAELGTGEVDGIVADLGLSSHQIELSGRGFSFLRNEPLDMRMDPTLEVTARDIVNETDVEGLANLIKTYGEEKWATKIARAIAKARGRRPINTSLELANIISSSIPKKFHPRFTHPATRTFQAIRIAVNNELENIKVFLYKAVPLLRPGGRIAVACFHSLEDRIVKNVFKKLAASCTCPPELPECLCDKKSCLNILTRTPLQPGIEEAMENRRSRSAKLRAGERI
ncbi:MAG: 16S rRNA (cytosine(1402)-N(4))-methyltransferase RsmH [Thermodesulfobacteriota bacterium]